MGRAFEVRKASMLKTSNQKAKVYSRYGKEVYMAAKAGVPDPEMNTGLKRMIEKAKANQVPADVIKRAIEKAKGTGGEDYQPVSYEGIAFGGNGNFIVDCLTDNINRTIADVRACVNKSHAKMTVNGAVSFQYDSLGILTFQYEDEEKMLECLMDNDCEINDMEVEEGMMTLYTLPTDLYKVKDAVETLIPNCEFEVCEQKMLAQEYVTLEGEELELFNRLLSLLDEVDDVQNIYHNVSL
ncbi:MAG: YebC/PmpR family DNA-binding transcriptional regulator [Erysipelotrichaceae bacterium]